MKRILIFSMTYAPTRIGGAEIAIQEITNRIPDSEIEFHMVTLRIDKALPTQERMGNVTVHRVGPSADIRVLTDNTPFVIQCAKVLFPLTSFLLALKLHKEKPFDGIWAMMAAYAGFGALFFKLVHPRVPYLLTLQEGDPIPYILKKVRLVRPLFSMIFTRADHIQTISNYLAEWATAMNYKGPLSVIPNGVDTTRFSLPIEEEEKERYRTKMRAGDKSVLLITTSRLVRKNGLDTVIEALPLLDTHVQFVILGTGPEESHLKELAKNRGVLDRVLFLGQVPYTELPRYLHAADIFIRPSRSEGMGNSFIEAMAAHIPVIATQEGGIKDFLFDRDKNPDKPSTGFAVNVDSPEDIAAQIQFITSHSGEAGKTIAQAYDMVKARYEWDEISRKMKEIFLQIPRTLQYPS